MGLVKYLLDCIRHFKFEEQLYRQYIKPIELNYLRDFLKKFNSDDDYDDRCTGINTYVDKRINLTEKKVNQSINLEIDW